MATLKGFQRRNPLSSFRRTGVSAGIGFDLIAQGLEKMAERAEPAAIEEMKRRGADEGYGAARASYGGLTFNTPEYQALEAHGGPTVEAGEWLVHKNSGAVRNKPISPRLQNALSFLPEMGITMEVFSGGQPAKGSGKPRVGSVRHDHGDSADAFFYKDGRRLDWRNEDDIPILQEIVSRAVGRGITGIGAGEGYMQPGSMHIGFGNPAVWGAGGKGANAPQWLREAYEAGRSGATPSFQQTAEPEVLVRTKSGSLEPRLFSPYSGPILQAYNSAAGVAYQSEVLNSAAVDLLNISHQFEANPEGFQQAAQGYLDQILENAPSMYRAGIREGIGTEINRRLMGVMEERQSETMQRANNSSRALVERWSQTYAEALAAGNAEEAETARNQLDAVLRSREALPGIAWTPEQSANVLSGAERQAQRIQATRDAELTKQAKADLELVRDAAKGGMYAEREGILSDPLAMEMHPELWREASAFVRLRDNMPEFLSMTPDEMAETVAQMRQEPISEEWQMDIVNAAAEMAKEHAKAWREDPVQQAQDTLAETEMGPPPALPDLTAAQPEDIVSALSARHEYMNRVFDAGYTDTRAYFSEEESEMMRALMSQDTPAELRVAMAGAVVSGFGQDAMRVMDEIGGDSLTTYAGKMMALTGNATTAAEVLKGQQILQEGAVSIPANSSFSEVYSASFAEAMAGLPPQAGRSVPSQVIEAARAIYAARMVKAPVSEADADEAMKDAMSAAIGQGQNKRGEPTGGVQEVLGKPTLLPPGVSGPMADRMLRQSLGAPATTTQGVWNWATTGPGSVEQPQEMNADAWRAAAVPPRNAGPAWEPSPPMLGGQPLDSSMVRYGQVSLIAIGPRGYRMQISDGAAAADVTDQYGNVYVFDLQALMEAMQ